jgi:ABC-2 type transport system ATP-binding protein
MRRRLDLAVSLVATPPVLFLDEPTTGLDPRSRTELWEVLRGLVKDGTTLLLTTQYLEEADQLADDIIVIDKGRIIAQGTPTQLKQQSGRASVVVHVATIADLERAAAVVRRCAPEIHIDEASRRITAKADGLGDMILISEAINADGVEVDDIGLARPSLDDVFLHLTGHRAEDETDGSDELLEEGVR